MIAFSLAELNQIGDRERDRERERDIAKCSFSLQQAMFDQQKVMFCGDGSQDGSTGLTHQVVLAT